MVYFTDYLRSPLPRSAKENGGGCCGSHTMLDPQWLCGCCGSNTMLDPQRLCGHCHLSPALEARQKYRLCFRGKTNGLSKVTAENVI